MLRRVQVPKLYGPDYDVELIQEPSDNALGDLQLPQVQRQQVLVAVDSGAGSIASAPVLHAAGQRLRVERVVLNFFAALAADGTNYKELSLAVSGRVLYRLSNKSEDLDPARDYDTKIPAFTLSPGAPITQERVATAAGSVFPASAFTVYYREL